MRHQHYCRSDEDIGDGGIATSGVLYFPRQIALDADRNVYIADMNNHRVRFINASTGLISTIAGTGVYGYSEDGGAAIFAQIKYPRGVAVDADGNVYIADTDNHRVRFVNASTGLISTIAGTGGYGYSGDGGAATSAQMRSPRGVALDADGNVYIADMNNHRIRKLLVPTLRPTASPTPGPTHDPTPSPTPDPTPDPTPSPTPDPTHDPTPDPTPIQHLIQRLIQL